MTSRRFGKKQLLLLTVIAGFGNLSSAAGQSGPQGAPDCAAGPRLCYDLPVNVGPLINTANFEGGPSLSQDGLMLLFGAARLNSLGQLDEDIRVAMVHIGLGETDRSFEWLQKAFEARDWQMALLKVEPAFDGLRSDPRFAALVERVGLPR